MDEPYKSNVSNIFDDGASALRSQWLSFLKMTNKIWEIHDEQKAIVNLIIHISKSVHLPALRQMVAETHFEEAVSEDTIVLVKPMYDLLVKHCLANGIIQLTPEESKW